VWTSDEGHWYATRTRPRAPGTSPTVCGTNPDELISELSNLMLHRATCWTISRLPRGTRTFTGDYSKLRGSRAELELRARRLSRSANSCGHCL
jgi:hypothetical protein